MPWKVTTADLHNLTPPLSTYLVEGIHLLLFVSILLQHDFYLVTLVETRPFLALLNPRRFLSDLELKSTRAVTRKRRVSEDLKVVPNQLILPVVP